MTQRYPEPEAWQDPEEQRLRMEELRALERKVERKINRIQSDPARYSHYINTITRELNDPHVVAGMRRLPQVEAYIRTNAIILNTIKDLEKEEARTQGGAGARIVRVPARASARTRSSAPITRQKAHRERFAEAAHALKGKKYASRADRNAAFSDYMAKH